jgi:hypothetical protein
MVFLQVKLLKNLKDKSFGLIGKKQAYPVTFKTRFGIHTFGLKFPIDVLILNSNNRVVAFKKEMLPNRIFFWPIQYEIVVELPEGEIGQHNINIGNYITLNKEI